MTRTRPVLILASLALIVGVPLAGKWARRHQAARCELDGLPVEPLYRVWVVDQAGVSHEFCCGRCAHKWLQRQANLPAAVYVTDEASGGELDAASAWFVQSEVVTNPVTGNRLHAFRDRAAAEEHARAFDGDVLTGDQRPFRRVSAPGAGR